GSMLRIAPIANEKTENLIGRAALGRMQRHAFLINLSRGNLGAKSVTATRSELGLRTDKSFAMQDSILTLRGRAAWAHDFNNDRTVAATFQTLPGASFVVNG